MPTICDNECEAARGANPERPLTHSLDLGEEGLAMQATRPSFKLECKKCGQPRTVTVRVDGHNRYRCRPCENEAQRAQNREWARANRERWAGYQAKRVANGRHRDTYLRRRYGITAAEYAAMYEAQSGLCWICARPETRMQRGEVMPLCVDHDHATGAVRALLCHACNTFIGHAGEDVEILARAVAYLEAHRG